MMICFLRYRNFIQLARKGFPIRTNITAGFFYNKSLAHKAVIGVLFFRQSDGSVGVVKTSQQRNNTRASIREAGQQDRNLSAVFCMMFLFLMMPYMLKGFFLEIKMNFSDCIKW